MKQAVYFPKKIFRKAAALLLVLALLLCGCGEKADETESKISLSRIAFYEMAPLPDFQILGRPDPHALGLNPAIHLLNSSHEALREEKPAEEELQDYFGRDWALPYLPAGMSPEEPCEKPVFYYTGDTLLEDLQHRFFYQEKEKENGGAALFFWVSKLGLTENEAFGSQRSTTKIGENDVWFGRRQFGEDMAYLAQWQQEGCTCLLASVRLSKEEFVKTAAGLILDTDVPNVVR